MIEKRKYQKGQATAEMTIAMIGIMAIIAGFLAISQLSRTSIENLLRSKANADINSYNGIYHSNGSSIRYWNSGEDQMEMSPDDTAITITNDNPSLFRSELSNGSFNLASDLGNYVQNNFATQLSSDYIFLSSANLTSAKQTDEIELEDSSRFLYEGPSLFGIRSVTIENTVYMPVIGD